MLELWQAGQGGGGLGLRLWWTGGGWDFGKKHIKGNVKEWKNRKDFTFSNRDFDGNADF